MGEEERGEKRDFVGRGKRKGRVRWEEEREEGLRKGNEGG